LVEIPPTRTAGTLTHVSPSDSRYPDIPIIVLWVDETWSVEEVSITDKCLAGCQLNMGNPLAEHNTQASP